MEIKILQNTNYKNQESLFEQINKILLQKNYVTNDFIYELWKREKEFPTGLEGTKLNIAIPHVDPKFIKKTAIFIVVNKNNIEFRRMDNNQKINLKVIIFILSKESKQHIGILQKIVELSAFEKEPTKKILEEYFNYKE